MHGSLLKAALFASIAGCAAVGLWVMVGDTAASNLWLAIPGSGGALAAVLLMLEHAATARGYTQGVSSSQTDVSTRLPALPVARQILAREFAAAERGRPLTIVLFRIDNYRRIAPLQGGAVGEKVLLSVGAVLRRRTRGMNVSTRLADAGCFLSVLGGVDNDGATTFAGRVRKDIGALKVAPQALALSLAICEYQPHMQTVENLLGAAQDLLRTASATRVSVAS